jgi:DNA end-binding protein Ku
MRAFWTGSIGFGLVSIGCKLYPATRDADPHFHQLHKTCGSRITTVRRCPECKVDLEWGDIGKGYEVEPGRYALFSAEELAKLEGEGVGDRIEILEFIEAARVDWAQIETSYWIGPSSRARARGYELLRQVLEERGQAGLGTVRLRTRTRVALVRPRDGALSLDMLRPPDELIDAGDELAPSPVQIGPGERTAATKLVTHLSAEFDPGRYADLFTRFQAAVANAVDDKIKAGQVSATVEGDLSAALVQSLKTFKKRRAA